MLWTHSPSVCEFRAMSVGVCCTAVCVTSLSSDSTADGVVSWPPIASATSFTAITVVSAVVRLRNYFVYQVTWVYFVYQFTLSTRSLRFTLSNLGLLCLPAHLGLLCLPVYFVYQVT